MKQYLDILRGDKVIWLVSIVLGIISIVSVYSFIPVLTKQTNQGSMYYLIKHSILVISGFGIMYLFTFIKPNIYSKIAKFAIWAGVFLMVFTLLFGVRINDAGRWLQIPFIGLRFQTSDLAKVAVVVFLAKALSAQRYDWNDVSTIARKVFLPIGIIIFLILRENLSTAALLMLVVVVLLFVAKVPGKWFLYMGVGGIIGGLLIVLVGTQYPELFPRAETWANRIINMFSSDVNNEGNMQIHHSLMAINEGGIFGKGPGHGVLKLYIPEAYADFFYAVFIEEFGLIGGVVLVMLYGIILFRAIKIVVNEPKAFNQYLALGLSLVLLIQALVNMMVCVKLMPVTGQNIPLLGMGGTSIWFTCISLGIILSISTGKEAVKTTKNQIG